MINIQATKLLLKYGEIDRFAAYRPGAAVSP